MNVNVTGAYVYFTIPIFGGIPITQTTVSHGIVTLILCTASVILGRNLKKRPGKMQVLVEKGVTMLQKMVAESMGEQNIHWVSFIGTIFLSSLLGSFIGLTGFLRSSTADLSCTLVWSLMVSGIIWYNGIRHKGFTGWLKGFTEPIAVMTPMNLISEIAQPVSMAFRHFGNIAGGGVITSILYTALGMLSSLILNLITASGWLVSGILLAVGIGFLMRWKKSGRKFSLILGIMSAVLGFFGLLESLGVLTGIPILSYGIPAVLSCYFDLFSGFVQAYVFTLLSMVYISGSLPAQEITSTR